jgi:hypothetical protein
MNRNLDDEDSESEDADTVTIEEIKNRLGVLKVSTPMECIQVLMHSYRVFCDLESDNVGDISVILMKWLDIDHQSETICFIKNRHPIGFSRYFYDCKKYRFGDSDTVTCEKIKTFINDLLNENTLNKSNEKPEKIHTMMRLSIYVR